MTDEKKEDSSTVWKTIFSSDKVTAALIVLLGGGNLLATKESDVNRKLEVDRAIVEIHELSNELRPMLDRQKDMQSKLEQLVNRK